MTFESDSGVAIEKNVNNEVSDAPNGIVKDWDAEEGPLRRKIDCILLPILGIAFFSLQIDRMNISAVLTSTITDDLGITTNQVNVGSQLLSAGIVVTEIPSNIFAWGLVATFQAFIQSYPAYLATRLLLGMLEGGFIPGALYYLSTWYKRDETSFRATLFFFGQMLAGLLTLDGKGGLAGWRWVWLAGDGRPLISMGRWSYFTERESQVIRDRVILDDPLKVQGHIKITGRDIWDTIRKPNVIQHFMVSLVAMSAYQGLTHYTPSMIKSFGFDSVDANALASVPVYCSMVWTLVLAYLSDWLGHRGPFMLLAITWDVIAYPCLRTTPWDSSQWHKYGVICVANVAYISMHILNVGWLSVYCERPQERSVAMAVIVMAANCAGISGSQIFRTSDKPRYIYGLTAICALAGAALVLAAVLNLYYFFRKRGKLARKSGS
ncbi:uncharacterized protein ASPGLDRAFT_64029 [Aspergillus glaucus CBS 516.65]|uniref:Major facilitator superfamily (MFS) profile domain-containing protein n=1 Tax=Aspergillus glaucus CBS 516.65 TaxID=1160497 RepID=A0A1L9VVN5_ASPGL|nr:hypothetical protein ASPGLDRAFT_64029 [Aspergillus glaucus CBS 516.65]OJJ87961.1 hypothetical protein ASPGLDRAFT_64029 [Aspergillus glaucus CBS 516.65]